MDIIEEIQIRNYNKFKGSNEADLMIREEIVDLVFSIPPPVNKTAEDMLKEYTDGFYPTIDNDLNQDLIHAMEEYANQFKQ